MIRCPLCGWLLRHRTSRYCFSTQGFDRFSPAQERSKVRSDVASEISVVNPAVRCLAYFLGACQRSAFSFTGSVALIATTYLPGGRPSPFSYIVTVNAPFESNDPPAARPPAAGLKLTPPNLSGSPSTVTKPETLTLEGRPSLQPVKRNKLRDSPRQTRGNETIGKRTWASAGRLVLWALSISAFPCKSLLKR